MAESAVVTNEADLWSLLEDILSSADAATVGAIQVQGWRPPVLYFPDEKEGHSITPTIAKSVLGFNNSISKSYAFLLYGEANIRRLKREDKEKLELKTLVMSGSNLLEMKGEDFVSLLGGLADKMSGDQVLLVSVLFLILFFGSGVMRDWIREQQETKRHSSDSHERVELSELETKRLGLVSRALIQYPEMGVVAEIAKEGKEELLQAVVNEGHASVLGVQVTGDEAKAILAVAKKERSGLKLDGIYFVDHIDTKNEDGHRAHLRNAKDGMALTVAMNENEIPDEDVANLFDALRRKTRVHAIINALFRGERVIVASIMRASSIP